MLLHSAQVRRDVIEWTEKDGLSGRGEGETQSLKEVEFCVVEAEP